MSTRTMRASCLCGSVRWEVEGPIAQADPASGDLMALLSMSHCHCSRCRKAHGAPYATYLVVPEDRFRITEGREHIVRFPSSPQMFRPFCGTCGSVVPDGVAWNGIVGLPAGPFDDELGMVPRCHIFVASKAPWVTLPDDHLPRFDAYPKAFGGPVMETRPPLDPDTGNPRGSCLCGEVAYAITAPAIRCLTCHCSRCRKASSAAHQSGLVVPIDGLQFTRGEENLVTYKVPEARFFTHRFCKTCGSSMPRKLVERGIAAVPMGSLDDDPGVRPALHIHVGSRASWDVITDGLPQYQETPPA
ncbi:MAG: GFA family protein [Minicystis sp.]